MNNAIILSASTRPRAHRAIDEARDGYLFTPPSEPKKKRIQEEKYHAMIGDIAKQVDLIGERRDREDAKRLLIDAFSRVMAASGTPLKQSSRIVPSLDGSGFVQLGIQSRHFLVSEASEFIEYLYAFGSNHNVIWSEKVDVPGWYRERKAA